MGYIMTNPVEVPTPVNAWTKVATSVTAGFVRILDYNESYLYTQRDTGDPAPTLKSEGAIFEGKSMEISTAVASDVYIYCSSGTGNVRVDL